MRSRLYLSLSLPHTHTQLNILRFHDTHTYKTKHINILNQVSEEIERLAVQSPEDALKMGEALMSSGKTNLVVDEETFEVYIVYASMHDHIHTHTYMYIDNLLLHNINESDSESEMWSK